jgi:pilus assembly protein FimV
MATAKRDQLIQEAEKLAAKGKLDAAVEQFQKALKQGPPDGVLLNRLGDLLLKANRVAEAVAAYQQAADIYAQQGFALKAIAAEKKANRADPQRTDTYERLAEWYYRQGMPVEGRQQLLTLGDWYLRNKQLGEAIRVYRNLAQREPGNFQIRAKLVDLLATSGDRQAAAAELEALGLSLVQRGQLDEAQRLLERALDMGLAAGKLGAALLEAFVATGRLPTALEVVRKLEAREFTPELAVAMARVLVEAGELGRARELVEHALPEIGERTEVVQLYGDILLRVGEGEAAKERLLPTVDRLLAAGDRERAGQLLKRLLKANPRDVEVLERGLAVFDRRSDGEFFSVLEAALADAYFQQGRRQEAAELYLELAQREPENNLYRSRLQELGVRPTQPEILHRPQAAPTTPPEEIEVEIALEEELGGEVQTAPEAVLGAPATFAKKPEEEQGELPTGSQLDPEQLYTEAAVLAKYGLLDKALEHLQQLLAAYPEHAKGRELLASLGGKLEAVEEAPEASPVPQLWELPPAAPSPVEPPPAPVWESAAAPQPQAPVWEPPAPVSFTLQALAPPPAGQEQLAPVPEQPPVAPPPPGPQAPPAAPKPAPKPKPALDDLEALLGLTPKKPVAPPRQPEAPPPAPAPAAPEPEIPQLAVPQFQLPTPLEAPAQAAPEVPPPAAEVPELLAEPVELVELSQELLEPPPEQLAELDFLLEQGLAEQAKDTYQRLAASFPESVALAERAQKLAELAAAPVAPVEHSAEELFAEEQGFFNLAAELEKELAEEEEKQLVAEARGEGAQEESIEELFRQFQKGVAEQLGEEDYATHFDLGLAYREMGLLDEAIGEFQQAAKAPELFLDATTLIGACYMDKGLPEEAAFWYEKALATPELPAESQLGLRYELARALEAAGNLQAALAHYAGVLAVSPTYRDVVERVTRLRTATN